MRSGNVIGRLSLSAFIIALAAATPAALADLISFQEGVSSGTTVDVDVEDAELRSSNPNDSFEQNPRWNIGFYDFGTPTTEREVAAFPISLPAGAVVTGVTLDLWQNGDSFGAHKTLNLYEVTNADFTFEGQNVPTQIDGVTWNSANEGDGELWITPGGDFDPTVLSSITPTTNAAGTQYTFASSAAFIAAVNDALAGDGLLRLIAVATDETTIGFESFRGSDQGAAPAEQHPRLNIEFEIVPEPASAASLALAGLALAARRRRRGRD